jgi:hypothetical protein
MRVLPDLRSYRWNIDVIQQAGYQAGNNNYRARLINFPGKSDYMIGFRARNR